MSMSPDPIFSEMRKELTEVGVQSVIFSVGIAVIELQMTFITDVFLKWLILKVLLFVAAFKTCSMYTPPKMKSYDAPVHEYPLAQIMVDIFFWAVISLVSDRISQLETVLTTKDRLGQGQGQIIVLADSFCTTLNVLILSRGAFLFMDWVGGGQLSRIMRRFMSKEIEGLSVGKTNIHQN